MIDGAVSRPDQLKADHPVGTRLRLKQIEAIVHPLVGRGPGRVYRARQMRTSLFSTYSFDLFETGGNQSMDAVACVTVSAPEDVQQRTRPGARHDDRGSVSCEYQGPNRCRTLKNENAPISDYVIETDTLENARAQVQDILDANQKGPMNHCVRSFWIPKPPVLTPFRGDRIVEIGCG